MTMNNEILNHIIQIREDTSAIKEHLKTLNGKVATNINKINCNEKKINNVNLKLAKWGGAIGAFLVIIQLMFKFMF